jgi:hypothetical protein
MNEIGKSTSRIFISSSNTSNWVYSDTNTSLNVPVNPFVLADTDPAQFTLSLESASIPLSIWTINETNNVLRFNDRRSFIIDYGNYSITALITYLNSYNDGIFNNTGVFVFSYDSINNRIKVISYDTGSPFATSLKISPETTCQKITGFVVGTYTTIDVTTGKPFNKGTNQVNLTFTTGILIAINNLQLQNRDNQSTASGGTILTRIPINCPLYRILTFYTPTPTMTTISNRVISSLDIRLLNDDYTPLILQGNPNYNLTFRVDYIQQTKVDIPQNPIQQAREIRNKQLSQMTQSNNFKPRDLTSVATPKIIKPASDSSSK